MSRINFRTNYRIKSMVLAAVCALSLGAISAHAEQLQKFGDYEVHYVAFNSSFLQPDVAEAYELQRSNYHALVNISVLRVKGNQKTPVKARISGNKRNLIGQTDALGFRQVTEGEAVYYLADFRIVDDEQLLTFDLNVQPEEQGPEYKLQFQQKFYVE